MPLKVATKPPKPDIVSSGIKREPKRILSSDNGLMAFIWHSRIRVVDTDVSTRIHYSALFRHVEAAETEFLRSLGLEYPRWFEMGLSLPRIHVEADYLAPLNFDDEIDTEMSVERIGDSSLTLGFRVVKTASGEVGARGQLVGVCMDIQSGKSTPIPAAIRQALEQAQAG
jgi:YbgC/YbaW family acyl-CoA thioester hydrolase